MNKKILKNITILVGSAVTTILAFKLAIFYMPFLIAFTLYLLIEPGIKFLMKKFKIKRKTSSILILIISISAITRANWLGCCYNYIGSFQFAKEFE